MIKKGKSYKCLPNGLLGTFTVGKVYTAPTDNHLRNDDGVSITICGKSCVYDWSGYFTEVESDKYKDVIAFMGTSVHLDEFGSGYLWGNQKDGSVQMLADFEIRGYGAIQNLFLNKKGKFKKDGEDNAAKFQDRMQEFIIEAINEKMDRER
tara:strand:+ start:152 stop:604 length:453 start_codon:yes stop_codon:yes gene_type:complete